MEWLTETRWSPYLVGAGIGVLSWLAFVLSNKPLGCSTAFARTSGMLEKLALGREKVEAKPYYQKFAPVIDSEWLSVRFFRPCYPAISAGNGSPRCGPNKPRPRPPRDGWWH